MEDLRVKFINGSAQRRENGEVVLIGGGAPKDSHMVRASLMLFRIDAKDRAGHPMVVRHRGEDPQLSFCASPGERVNAVQNPEGMAGIRAHACSCCSGPVRGWRDV